MSSKEEFNQISPSEFFYRNRDLAGFSNPTRSLYTAVREFVENSLDACDHSGILPNIHMTIKAVDPEKPDPKQYIQMAAGFTKICRLTFYYFRDCFPNLKEFLW